MTPEQTIQRLAQAGIPAKWRKAEMKLATQFGSDPKVAKLVDWSSKENIMTKGLAEVVEIVGTGPEPTDLSFAVSRKLVLKGRPLLVINVHDLRRAVNERDTGALEGIGILTVQGLDELGDIDWPLDWFLVDWLNNEKSLIIVASSQVEAVSCISPRLSGMMFAMKTVSVQIGRQPKTTARK